MANADYTYEDEDKGIRVECTVEARIVPYVPASYMHPPEGGYLEDESFTVDAFYLTVGGKEFEIPLTDDLRAALVGVVQEDYDGDEDKQIRLYDRLADRYDD